MTALHVENQVRLTIFPQKAKENLDHSEFGWLQRQGFWTRLGHPQVPFSHEAQNHLEPQETKTEGTLDVAVNAPPKMIIYCTTVA